MSRIWESLKHVEQRQVPQPPIEDTQPTSWLPERRCGERRRVCLPVFVYGHSAERGPFYESTEVLYANNSGGLITLQADVAPGDKLLLTIKQSSRDQECRIIGVRSTYLNRSAVAVEFCEPLLDTLPVHDRGSI